MSHKRNVESEGDVVFIDPKMKALSSLDGEIGWLAAFPYGLQHVLAMFVANLAPIAIIAAAAGLPEDLRATLIQNAMFIAGIGTFVQLFPLWRVGSGLPIVMGISFTFVSVACTIAATQGYGALVGAVIVGGLIGTVGVGGILLIPALSGLGGLTTHAAMATSLFSFIFTGLLGTWLYCKHGSIHWGITIPVCIGGLVGGYPGALANAIAPAWILNLILGCIIIFAGIYALFPAKGGTITYRPGDGRQRLQLLLIGATVGFGSGLTGVGGPVLSVPLMVILGFTPLTSIATSQVIQITAATSGSISNFANGFVDLHMALLVTVAELAGVVAGAKLAHSVSSGVLKKMVSVVCIVVGAFIFVRALLQA